MNTLVSVTTTNVCHLCKHQADYKIGLAKSFSVLYSRIS